MSSHFFDPKIGMLRTADPSIRDPGPHSKVKRARWNIQIRPRQKVLKLKLRIPNSIDPGIQIESDPSGGIGMSNPNTAGLFNSVDTFPAL